MYMSATGNQCSYLDAPFSVLQHVTRKCLIYHKQYYKEPINHTNVLPTTAQEH